MTDPRKKAEEKIFWALSAGVVFCIGLLLVGFVLTEYVFHDSVYKVNPTEKTYK